MITGPNYVGKAIPKRHTFLTPDLSRDAFPRENLLWLQTSFFRALAGLWPVPKGTVASPAAPTGVFLVPQRPYAVLGTLADQITYPQKFEERGALPMHALCRLLASANWLQQLASCLCAIGLSSGLCVSPSCVPRYLSVSVRLRRRGNGVAAAGGPRACWHLLPREAVREGGWLGREEAVGGCVLGRGDAADGAGEGLLPPAHIRRPRAFPPSQRLRGESDIVNC